MLKNENTALNLSGTNEITGSDERAILCRKVNATHTNSGRLIVNGNIYCYGEEGDFVDEKNRISLTSGEVIYIGADEYADYCKGAVKLTFNANGGICNINSKEVYVGEPVDIDSLPIPTRDYYTFIGWFKEDRTQVTSETEINDDTVLYAHWELIPYTVSWDTGNGYTVSVSRTSSSNKGAAIGELSSGDAIYYGDILNVVYTANTGYSISTKGITSVSVTGNITKNDVFADVTANTYVYEIVYKSTNGTKLGSKNVEAQYGTIDTVSGPDIAGYITPAAQTVTWNETSKTVTLTYAPSSVATSNSYSGTYDGKYFKYNATVYYRNRTENSVEVCVWWEVGIQGTSYRYYGQNLRATAGGSSAYARAKGYTSSYQVYPASAQTQWITVSLNTTNQTWVPIDIYVYQTNANDKDMSTWAQDPAYGFSATWGITVPAF